MKWSCQRGTYEPFSSSHIYHKFISYLLKDYSSARAGTDQTDKKMARKGAIQSLHPKNVSVLLDWYGSPYLYKELSDINGFQFLYMSVVMILRKLKKKLAILLLR